MSLSEYNIGFDKPGEECGVFGLYAPGEPVAQLAYLGLQALQHRGQQGAGISLSNGEDIFVLPGQGKVHDVFSGGDRLRGYADHFISTGHVRYGTVYTPEHLKPFAIQPLFYSPTKHSIQPFTIAQNGHIESAHEVATAYGVNTDNAASDTELMKRVIGYDYERTGDLEKSLQRVLPDFEGAYSLVLSTPDRIIAARDPKGFRPFHLGRLASGRGWVPASEIAALRIINARPEREIQPGEILTIGGTDTSSLESREFAAADPTICGFEFVYFSRPDNVMHGQSVAAARLEMGRLLARNDDVEADLVVGVPDSGTYAADGYSQASGIPHERVLVRNNAVDRSFIAPNQDMREQSVRNKLNPIESMVEGKRIVVIDDSIVRGTTQMILVKMLRDAGAAEIHVRISSPEYLNTCHWGMDTGRKEELIAANMTTSEICDYIKADSLKYLSPEDLQKAVGKAAGKICTACTTKTRTVSTPVRIS